MARLHSWSTIKYNCVRAGFIDVVLSVNATRWVMRNVSPLTVSNA